MITSVNNDEVKEVAKLFTSKGRKEKNMFVVEGPHLVLEAKKCGVLLKTYTTTDKYEGTLVSEGVMKKMCNTITPTTVIGVCKMFENKRSEGHILALDRVQDPGNMGSLMRSAVSFGFNTIILNEGCVDIYNDKVIRSSQGAIFRLSFIKANIVEYLSHLQDYQVFSTNVNLGNDVTKVEKGPKMVLILGNEGQGVSEEINKMNYQNLYIPIKKMESLNVSVAGGILMYELTRSK